MYDIKFIHTHYSVNEYSILYSYFYSLISMRFIAITSGNIIKIIIMRLYTHKVNKYAKLNYVH